MGTGGRATDRGQVSLNSTNAVLTGRAQGKRPKPCPQIHARLSAFPAVRSAGCRDSRGTAALPCSARGDDELPGGGCCEMLRMGGLGKCQKPPFTGDPCPAAPGSPRRLSSLPSCSLFEHLDSSFPAAGLTCRRATAVQPLFIPGGVGDLHKPTGKREARAAGLRLSSSAGFQGEPSSV